MSSPFDTEIHSAPTGVTTLFHRCLLVAALALASAPTLAQDDYLLELEGDLEGLEPIESIEAPSAAIDAASAPTSMQQEEFLDQIGTEIDGMEGPASGDSGVVPENARSQFDSDLQDRMPGTFVLYNRLEDDQKTIVFEEYQVSGDYLRVRRKIIELRRSR